MRSYNIHQAKTHLSRLVEAVAENGEEFIIAKAGKPVARLVPFSAERKARALGTLTGAVRETPDWWGPDPALEDLFYGATRGKPKRVAGKNRAG